MFISGVVAWLLLTTRIGQAYSIENVNDLRDTITTLADNLSQLSARIEKQSEQLAEQSEKLTEVMNKQVKQSKQLAEVTKKQAVQSEQLAEVMNKQADQFQQLTDQSEQLIMLTEQSNRFGKMSHQQADLNDRVDTLEEEAAMSSAGPTFVRWGKSSCNGTNSRMVYSGVASGTSSLAQGGGANLLCLPKNPSFDNYDESGHNGINVVVAEYKMEPDNNFPFEANDPLLLDNDVPCVVCEVTNGSSVMMIPARVDCYSDWTMEYRGYLMTGDVSTTVSEFVCVDKNPEVLFGGDGPADYSTGLYPTEAHCGTGSLPCPPYGHLWELACVVCSK